MNSLAEVGAGLLGGVVASTERLHGGDLSSVMLVVLEDGRRAVVKSGSAPRTEAAMLRAIAAAGVMAPAVLAVDDKTLVLAPVAGGGRLDRAWQDLGRQLAKLHQAAGPRYGWPEDYAFGPVTIENGWTDTWPDFYARHRLLTHLSFLPAPLARRVAALAGGLQNRLPLLPAAVLLHGDLWGGNIIAAGETVAAFIDPACFFGHAEIDLAMLGLFDRPAPAFFEAYGGPSAGYTERLPIYRLWPALVHLRLFGEGYRGLVEGLLHQAGV